MTGFSVFHHRLGHPRWQIKTILGNLTWETKGEKKKGHTQTHRERGFCEGRRGFRFKLKRTRGRGLVLHSGATLIFADSFHRWLCIQRQARSERTDENDLKQRVISTTHPPHNTQRLEFYSSYGFKMQSNRAPWPKRNMLVKHCCYWWFEVNIKPVPRCHFVNYNIAEVYFDKVSQRLTTCSRLGDFTCAWNQSCTLWFLWKEVYGYTQPKPMHNIN